MSASNKKPDYKRKCHLLRKKCESLQRGNEKIINRIYHVKKILRHYRKQRRFFMDRLQKFNDPFWEAEVPAFWEEGNVYRIMIENPTGLPGMEPPNSTQASPAKSGQASTTSSTTTKKKTEKKNGAPKRPINAYFMFCQERRHAVQQQHYEETGEEISRHELTKQLAVRWNNLSQEEKKTFYDRYEVAKIKYETDMKAFRAEQKRKKKELEDKQREQLMKEVKEQERQQKEEEQVENSQTSQMPGFMFNHACLAQQKLDFGQNSFDNAVSNSTKAPFSSVAEADTFPQQITGTNLNFQHDTGILSRLQHEQQIGVSTCMTTPFSSGVSQTHSLRQFHSQTSFPAPQTGGSEINSLVTDPDRQSTRKQKIQQIASLLATNPNAVPENIKTMLYANLQPFVSLERKPSQ